MGNQNRKATKQELAHARSVIGEAFPDMVPVVGAHNDFGGHRVPRDHTIAFRLRDEQGRFRSNVIWLRPDSLGTLTVADVQALVTLQRTTPMDLAPEPSRHQALQGASGVPVHFS